jgi:hypothetical protein
VEQLLLGCGHGWRFGSIGALELRRPWTVRPNVRGEAGPTARQPARRKDDAQALEPGGLPCRWASPRPRS